MTEQVKLRVSDRRKTNQPVENERRDFFKKDRRKTARAEFLAMQEGHRLFAGWLLGNDCGIHTISSR